MRPRVLHLTRDFPPRQNGGLSTAVGGLVAAATSCEHRVLSFDNYRPSSGGPATIEVDGSVARLSGAAAVASALTWACDTDPDIIHCHHAQLWSVARQIQSRTRAATVATCHVVQAALDALRQLERATSSARAEAEMVAQAQHLNAPSSAACDLIRHHYPNAEPEVLPLGTRIPDTVDTLLRDSLLFVGRFADVTGFSTFIDVAASAVEDAGCRVAVCGGLPLSPRGERRWLERAEEQLGEHLTYRGWLGQEALSEEYRRARVVVVPSTIETFCQVAAEAMAHGCAVVGYQLPALAELTSKCAVLVEPGDSAALTMATAALLDDGDSAESLGRRARQRISRHYTWNQAATAAQALWLSAAAGR